MTLSIAAITIDCRHAEQLATFWSAALDVDLDRDGPGVSEFFASLGRTDPSPGVPAMMFIQVPEAKATKNRVHLDLQADDCEAEVARLIGLGASHIHDKDEWGMRWTTLADPEGNEFCVASH